MSWSIAWRSVGKNRQMRRWVREQEDGSLESLWRACPRADWLLWHLTLVASSNGWGSASHRQLCLVAVHLARRGVGKWRSSPLHDGCMALMQEAQAAIEVWARGDDSSAASRQALFQVLLERDLVCDLVRVDERFFDEELCIVMNNYFMARTAALAIDLRHWSAAADKVAYWRELADEIREIVPHPPVIVKGSGQ